MRLHRDPSRIGCGGRYFATAGGIAWEVEGQPGAWSIGYDMRAWSDDQVRAALAPDFDWRGAAVRTLADARAWLDDYERTHPPTHPQHTGDHHTMTRRKITADPVGAVEIAERAGVARRTVDSWRQRHDDFPQPRWIVGGWPAWDWSDVTPWITKHQTGDWFAVREAARLKAAAEA